MGRGRAGSAPTALRRPTSSFPYWIAVHRGRPRIGRGEFDGARAISRCRRRRSARRTAWPLRRLPRRARPVGAPLGPTRAAAEDGLAGRPSARPRQIRVRLCAKGLRAQAELAALARARRDADALRAGSPGHGAAAVARRAGTEASVITPDGRGWLVLAEAEYERVLGAEHTELWTEAAESWQRLERPFLAAYCRWRRGRSPRRVTGRRGPRRARRLQRRTPSRRGSVRDHSSVSSSCWPKRARLDLLPAGRSRRRPATKPRRGPRPDPAGGEVLGLVARGLHEPRDRGQARHQCQDGERPRLAHPVQARCSEPARGGRDRAPSAPPLDNGRPTAER